MKKIAFFVRNFQVGGIQKAMVNLLEQLDYSRCRADVFYFEDEPFYELPQHENLRYVLCKPYPYAARLVPFALLKAISPVCPSQEDYDVAVDFSSYSSECAVGALSVKAKKRLMWIHNDVEIKLREDKKYRVLWRFFKGKFPQYDGFCAVSEGIIPSFRRMTGLEQVPITAVPNFIDTAAIFRKAAEPAGLSMDPAAYNLCSMGRLCHQKGFDILLDLVASVAAKRPDLHLTLIGDGEERQALTEQIKRLGLTDRVTMTGNLSNPFPLLEQMDGFALTSRYEGQGIALWEAKALGLELFMAKHLEKYNPGLQGCEDLGQALCGAKKREKQRDDLSAYNNAVRQKLEQVLLE